MRMKYRDAWGDKVYRLQHGFNLFEVSRNRSTGKWSIKKREPFYITDPVLMPLWDRTPEFDSYL